ncbi:MAG: molecular chaperone TorD family protein [Deltaproteobacteria bacterium]|nr:molecular chaperone TorD family protein [Deltaproteobacteria bacterium]
MDVADSALECQRDALRETVYRVLQGVFREPPSSSLLEQLERECLFEELSKESELVFGRSIGGLTLMQSGARPDLAEALRLEYAKLFVGPDKLEAPPWESVYRSPDRLVMQKPALEVLERYLEAGLGYDGITSCPPDHVARELDFMASLISRSRSGELDPARSASMQREFAAAHLCSWLPSFARDVTRAATLPYFLGAAELLADFTALESIALGAS